MHPAVSPAAARFDGFRLALINNRLEAVVGAMMNTLQRTARSAIMNMARDFSCGILNADDEILTVAESLPCHTFRGPDIQARYMKQCHPDMAKGDAFLHNDPYHGNSHAADWCILIPVIDAAAQHRFTVFAKAHVADCGNSIPTTFYATAADVYTSDGTYNAPRGVRGGGDGACARQYKRERDGSLTPLANFAQLKLEAGEYVVSMCTGGGGYGPPAERDPLSVAKDVAEGWVSCQRAREIYRVACAPDGRLDALGTQLLRAGTSA